VDDGKSYVLSVALAIGDVLLMSNYDDICPKVIHTSLAGLFCTLRTARQTLVLLTSEICQSGVHVAIAGKLLLIMVRGE